MNRPAALVAFAVACGCGQPARAPASLAPGETHVASTQEAAEAGAARMPAAEEETIAAGVDRMSFAQLAAAWPRMDPAGTPAQAVALRLALLSRHRGEPGAARRWLRRAGSGARVAAIARVLDRDDKPAGRSSIAVLLPLSGKYARIGREMRLAIEIAAAPDVAPPPDAAPAEDGADESEEARPAARVSLRFHDTRGDAAEAGRQVERAAVEGAIAVLGPVGQAEARVAAERAVEHGLAIGLLAPDDAGAAPEEGVFRLWPSATWEAAEAARLAIELGHDRLAVLHPRDAQGAAQAEAFRRAAEAGGARIVASGDYDPATKQLEAEMKRFLGLDPATNERLRRHLARRGRKQGWKTFSPDVPFDLLYVPDEHGPAALVASFLPYFNIEVRDSDVMDTLSLRRKHGGRVPSVVQLLGSSAWYHAGLISRGGDAVDGALVVVPCASATGDSAGDQAAELAERFEARAGRPPGPVASQAHDAALLLLAAASASARPRAGMTRALRWARLPDGACGPARMGPDGQLERTASLLRVDGEDFVPFEP